MQIEVRQGDTYLNSKVVLARKVQISWGPNQVFGKTEDLGFLGVKKVKTKFLAK